MAAEAEGTSGDVNLQEHALLWSRSKYVVVIVWEEEFRRFNKTRKTERSQI